LSQADTRVSRFAALRARVNRSDLLYMALVAVVYAVATYFTYHRYEHLGADRMMVLAERILTGHLDDPSFSGSVDSVQLGGRFYIAVGVLQVAPYLLFAPFDALHGVANYVVALVTGVLAAWLALPLARAYGARGWTAYCVAGFTAFGTLLFAVSVTGNFYYLAHAESFLALTCFLLEWAGRRRPAVLGVALALSFLARPTTVLAAIPFGLALIWRRRDASRQALLFGVPIAIGIVIWAGFNVARFGSMLETGYGISTLHLPSLIARRSIGLFSPAQIPENIRLAFLTGFAGIRGFPYITPSPLGLSMFLVSPGLLVAFRAGFGGALQRTLWPSIVLVAIPVFLFFGGGYVQYGFRYSLDFTPFLIPLIAIGVSARLSRLDYALFLLSVASVGFGVVWQITRWQTAA